MRKDYVLVHDQGPSYDQRVDVECKLVAFGKPLRACGVVTNFKDLAETTYDRS